MGRESSSPAVKIVLPLLAAALLVTGACGASAAKDEKPNQTTTTAVGGKSKKSPPVDRGTSPPDQRPDLTGTVTEVKRSDAGTNPFEWILVEEDPDVELSAGPSTEGWEKLYFEITDETRVFVRRGGDLGEVVPATATDLAKGQTVDAWHGTTPLWSPIPARPWPAR